jgi:hypothetical protein
MLLLIASLGSTFLFPIVLAQTTPKYSAKVPSYITTPDKVETSIGTLKFFDGLPEHEPADSFDPEIVELFAAIGIKKDRPFAPMSG